MLRKHSQLLPWTPRGAPAAMAVEPAACGSKHHLTLQVCTCCSVLPCAQDMRACLPCVPAMCYKKAPCTARFRPGQAARVPGKSPPQISILQTTQDVLTGALFACRQAPLCAQPTFTFVPRSASTFVVYVAKARWRMVTICREMTDIKQQGTCKVT